ncbi:neurofilament heavy polypeptide isoform X2 [Pararge aegeria]|uniref:neurofilament heavy polypeptide isoform X2 n=1 Tax=Pararge aegeria TaxID=116150 RepID=UPI0019D1D420|nr:neurofilament heavy polypeptide isoform X2 [Pararge aegeria]
MQADIPNGQVTGSGEGAPPNFTTGNVAPTEPPKNPTVVENVKSETAVPANAQEQTKTPEAAAIPNVEAAKPAVVKETKVEENAENPENAQPEHVRVEEIKSDAHPVNVHVVPEQVLVQEILTAATAKTDVAEQLKEDVKSEVQPSLSATEASVPKDDVKKEETEPKESADWQLREQQLLKIIENLETVKTETTENGLKLELKVREEEIDLLKARVKNLETELQAALSKPGGKNQEIIEKIKLQHEELLSKARGMIFDKTKVVKNQELQIEALSTQIQSLKDINLITKDLLEIRNSEVKAMEERLQVMEARFKGEKERYDLVLKRAQTSTNINDDLRREYETQLAIFKELREKYELRVQALVAENNRLKESLQGGSTSG